MADPDPPVEIEKLRLPTHDIEGPLLDTLSESEQSHVQSGADWLVNLASHALARHESAVIYTARAAPEDFVALPLKLDARAREAHALGNFYTSAYMPVLRSPAPERLLIALFRHLAEEEKLTGITLSPMDPDTPMFGQLQSALARAGWRGIHRYFCFGNWTHELSDPASETYLKGRPQRLNNTISRRTRQFLKDDRGQIELIGGLEGLEGLEGGIADFVTVYNRSWKQEEPFPEFVPALLRLAARRGWLRLGIARLDGAAIASQAWLVANGTAYIFKLAHDEAFKHLSPGTVLTAFMMQHVIDEDRVAKIDFLSGDDDYKRDWMSSRSERWGIAAYNASTFRGCAIIAARAMRSLLRR